MSYKPASKALSGCDLQVQIFLKRRSHDATLLLNQPVESLCASQTLV
jgi:hypothetical protein